MASGLWIAVRFGLTAALVLSCWLFNSPFLNILFSLIVLRVFYLFLRDFAGLPRSSWFFLILLCPPILFLLYYFPTAAPMPYLAVVLANLMVAYVFGNNLLRARPTVLLQFVKTAHLGPKPSKEFANYLWQQCVIWVAVSLLSAAFAGLALVSEGSRIFAGQCLFGLVAIQVIWFILSHEIARWRFGRDETWLRSLQLITQRSSWEKLEI